MDGITTCFHAFSGTEDILKGERLHIGLRKLDDRTLLDWYENHRNESNEEPFGHDVSDPFEFS